MATPSLAMIPSGYKASKVYSVLPESGVGDFDFTRATTATRINSSGLIEEMAINVPRLEYPLIDGVVNGCPSLLLEPQRTNLVTYSEAFDNAAWVKLGAGTGSAAIVTSDYAISPDGTQNASRLQCDLNGGLTSSGNQSLIYDTISGSGDTSGFIYVKSNTNSSQTFYLANSLNDYVNGVATTDWQRIEINWNAAGNARTFAIGTRGASNSDDSLDLLIWGAQVEEGSYPTSYIPTNGAAVTRNGETANGAGDASTFNDSEGVLMIEMAALADDGTNRLITISNGTTNNRLIIQHNSQSNAISCNMVVGGSARGVIDYVATDITSFNKIALKYSATNFDLYVNGILRDSGGSGSVMTANTMNELQFANYNGTLNYYGKAKQLQYYNSALNDSDLETITSWTSFTDLANGQQYSIK